MMKASNSERRWYFAVAITLVLISSAVYSIQLIFFKRPGETYFYMLQDLAFVPVQVLIVTIVIDRMLSRHEQRLIIKKISVGVGLFFSETGNNLIKLLFKITDNKIPLQGLLDVASITDKKKLKAVKTVISDMEISVKHDTTVLHEMKNFLAENRKFLVEMLENTNLSEHDRFTDMLLAISHLADELRMRTDISSLPESDINHLTNDMLRVYKSLLIEWLSYMMHIKIDYPYLYSLAIRSNPFKPDGSVVIYST